MGALSVMARKRAVRVSNRPSPTPVVISLFLHDNRSLHLGLFVCRCKAGVGLCSHLLVAGRLLRQGSASWFLPGRTLSEPVRLATSTSGFIIGGSRGVISESFSQIRRQIPKLQL